MNLHPDYKNTMLMWVWEAESKLNDFVTFWKIQAVSKLILPEIIQILELGTHPTQAYDNIKRDLTGDDRHAIPQEYKTTTVKYAVGIGSKNYGRGQNKNQGSNPNKKWWINHKKWPNKHGCKYCHEKRCTSQDHKN